MEKNQNLQPKEEEEQENCRTESLCLHIISSDVKKGNFSEFYKIDSSTEEPNFSQKPKLIPVEIPKNLPRIGFGPAICDSNLYLFGGSAKDCIILTKRSCYLDLVTANSSSNGSAPVPPQYNKHMMNECRLFPITVTIGKNIYIFGSQQPGYGDFPSVNHSTTWAEVFNTEDKLFRLISPPPSPIFAGDLCIGVVAALIEKNQILMATESFSDVFIYYVETDRWTSSLWRDKDTLSPFPLCSMRSPVIGDKYIFLYGSGKICAFDIDKDQFLNNNISLLEYTLSDQDFVILNGAIHHRGGWKFSVVFGDAGGYMVRFVYVVSFEIEDPKCCGELKVKAGTMNIVDHVLRGGTFIDSFMWSNQIVPSGNPNNGKQSLKSNLIVGGSSVTSHVDYGATSMPGSSVTSHVDYGATLMPDVPELRRNVGVLSKLHRKEAALDKEMFEMILEHNFLIEEISKLKKNLSVGKSGYDFFKGSLERLQIELSLTNMGETRVKNENVSAEGLLEEISSTRGKVEAQMIEREKMVSKIVAARHLVRSCSTLFREYLW